ncbi:MAG: helix-turn-helix domain-containing protein [Planctomycetaceae bacterium]
MAASASKAEKASKLRENEKKWGSALVDAGWTLIPSTILECQQTLGLDPVDLNILLQLARHWWQEGNPPHPSMKTIADCIGKHVSTVQRRITKLRKRGLIRIEHRHNKHGGQTSSKYYFDGLIAEGTKLAEEAIADRKDTKQKAANRRRRRNPQGPKLKVIQ